MGRLGMIRRESAKEGLTNDRYFCGGKVDDEWEWGLECREG